MNPSLHDYNKYIIERESVQSVMLLDNSGKCSSYLDGVDFLYLIVLNRPEPKWEVRKFVHRGKRIVEHWLSPWQIEQWLVQGKNERMIVLVNQAEILYDQHGFVKQLKERTVRLPLHVQKRRVCEEYFRMLRNYLDAKEQLHQQLILDAYQSVIAALHSWARLVACEAGEQPDELIWKQVKYMEPSVYKLYEELITGHEPLEKRIELQLLPIELSVMSKMKSSTILLTEIMQSEMRPWLYEELRQHPEVAKVQIDLHLLLEKMVKRSIIQEVSLQNEEKQAYEIGYMLAG